MLSHSTRPARPAHTRPLHAPPDTKPSPHPLVARAHAAPRTTVSAGPGAVFGGPHVVVIAGPCSVETRATLFATARAVAAAGATMLRGGAFKPRTSPYAFRGLGAPALELLAEARAATGLPVVTEVMDPRDVPLVAEWADMLQIGARNMQNYPLLAEVGNCRRPVLLKRSMSGTISELLFAAEHILLHGNPHVVFCERGIRTFETATRNTLDIAAVPVLQRETHLPVIVDPSHAGGRADLVAPLARAAIAAGADGIMVEVHDNPTCAKSDGEQSLDHDGFQQLIESIAPIAAATGRALASLPADARV